MACKSLVRYESLRVSKSHNIEYRIDIRLLAIARDVPTEATLRRDGDFSYES
jgi:hypothetical protein